MHKKQHLRSATAQQTAGVTLDHAAKVYDFLAPLMTLGLERRYHRIVIEQLALRGDERILDIGCGTGTLTVEIGRLLALMHEIDHNGLSDLLKPLRTLPRQSIQ